MRKQLSQLGMGIVLTLLLLGFSHKRTYGLIPVNSKGLSDFFAEFLTSQRADTDAVESKQINSLFVRPQKKESVAMLMLVAYDQEIVNSVREITQTKQTALIFSVSTLPYAEVHFEPSFLIFRQEGRSWHAGTKSSHGDVFPLGKNAKFGGLINDSDIHQGVILLPEWFDLSLPLTIQYLDYTRVISF
ncbi:MAG: hypothetical protein ACE5HO_02545 [bacterium]